MPIIKKVDCIDEDGERCESCDECNEGNIFVKPTCEFKNYHKGVKLLFCNLS